VCFIHTAIMCSAVVKFLSLTIACIAIIDGALWHERWEREPNGSNTSEFAFVSLCPRLLCRVHGTNQNVVRLFPRSHKASG